MFAAHLFDAVMLYAKALNRTIANLTEPEQILQAARDGRKLFNTITSEHSYTSEYRPIHQIFRVIPRYANEPPSLFVFLEPNAKSDLCGAKSENVKRIKSYRTD